MGIVRFALRFPYTFYVLAALILFLGVSVISVMPEEIFPEINIPVVSVIWQYTGYTVRTNAMPTTIEDLNNIPIKYTNGPTVFLKDVGQVLDGWDTEGMEAIQCLPR
jgi:multidrug efflux pump subunit AcrB